MDTVEQVQKAVGSGPPEEIVSCTICNYTGKRRRARIHVRQHYVRYYCVCKFQHISRDWVANQCKRRCRANNNMIFQVDQASFGDFIKHMGWSPSMSFPECVPTYKPIQAPSSSPGRERRSSRQRLVSQLPVDVQRVTLAPPESFKPS